MILLVILISACDQKVINSYSVGKVLAVVDMETSFTEVNRTRIETEKSSLLVSGLVSVMMGELARVEEYEYVGLRRRLCIEKRCYQIIDTSDKG